VEARPHCTVDGDQYGEVNKVEVDGTKFHSLPSAWSELISTSMSRCYKTSWHLHHTSSTPSHTMSDPKIAAVQAKLQTSSRDFQKLESGACR
jgi:hypothetical protein